MVIRGSLARIAGNLAGVIAGLGTAALLLRHLGVAESGRYVTVMSLVAIPGVVAESGLNVTGSRELALRGNGKQRRFMIANIVGQRLIVTPVGMLAAVAFAALAGYPQRMLLGTVLAGAGVLLVSVANALLLCLVVELRNTGLAVIDFVRQVATLAGVALLVALGAKLVLFFAVQAVVGMIVLALVPLVAGPRSIVLPRLERATQRSLLRTALPVAMAVVLGALYFRLVIVLMSLVSSARQTGYFAGSLRAMEVPVSLGFVVVGVALPLLATSARDDPARLRYAIRGLSEGALIAGALVVLVAVRASEPVMTLIGGHAFGPAGAVLRIQVVALLVIPLYQIWTVSLLALGRQRELIATSLLGLLAIAVFAAALVPPFGAQGGAAASVLGDATLACLLYWRLRNALGPVMVGPAFLARVSAAAATAGAVLLISGLPNLVAAALAGLLFLGISQLLGAVPREVLDALAPRHLIKRRSARSPL